MKNPLDLLRRKTGTGAPPAPGAGARRTLHAGGYAALVAAFAVAIAIVVNLVVSALPSTLTKPDLTASGIYSLSQQTEEALAGLETDVDIYLLAQSGQENSTLQAFLDRYAALSGHVHLHTVDPVVNPNFAAQYTEDQLYNNDLIVVCGERSRHISYYDIFQSSYTSYYEVSTEFYGEQAVTSAILYVTGGELPTIYALSGHGEADVPSAMAQNIEAQNYQLVEGLSLVTRDTVPEDASAVLIYGPASDLSAEDADKLNAYLDTGGTLLLFTTVTDTEMPNLESVTARFGLSGDSGMVMDGDRSHNAGYPHYLLPDINSHTITQPLIDSGYYALLINAHAIRTADTLPENATVSPLLTTSASGYIKADGMNLTTLEQEDGDEAGTFDVAVAATLTLDDGEADDSAAGSEAAASAGSESASDGSSVQSESAGSSSTDTQTDGSEDTQAEPLQASLVWFASTAMMDSSVDAAVAGGNTDLFLNALGWACGQQDTISIHAKSLDYEMLTVPSSARSLLTALTVAVLPLAMVACGVVIWHRRKVR